MTSPGQLSRRAAALSVFGSLLFAQSDGNRPRSSSTQDVPPDRWIVYYGNQEPSETFASCPYVVFDSRYHPPISPLLGQGRKIVGYLSLGEASPDYDYFSDLESAGILIQPSTTWPGNQYIDVRDRRWRERVYDQLVPWVLGQGFDGVFLDTLDSPLAMEESDPVGYSGMAAAAATLVQDMRRRHPGITIMLNRSYRLLPVVEQYIDVAVAESVYATYDFDRKVYVMVSPENYAQQLSWLRAAQIRRPQLKIFTLDYCDPGDRALIQEIYRVERQNGFCPYVTSIDLATVVAEPVSVRRRNTSSRRLGQGQLR
jgi:uncharacterized protein (TIGR01370 family)